MWEVEGHYQPEIDGSVGRLETSMVHDDHATLYHYFERHNRYSDWEAALSAHRQGGGESQLAIRGRLKSSFAAFPCALWLSLPTSYLFTGGLIDGRAGFHYAVSRSFYYWQIDLKRRNSVAPNHDEGRARPCCREPEPSDTAAGLLRSARRFRIRNRAPGRDTAIPCLATRREAPARNRRDRTLQPNGPRGMRRIGNGCRVRSALWRARHERGTSPRARQRALRSVRRRHGLEIEAVTADATRLPFADRSFDVVLVHDGLHHLEDPWLGLAEMARVARHTVSVTEPAEARSQPSQPRLAWQRTSRKPATE